MDGLQMTELHIDDPYSFINEFHKAKDSCSVLYRGEYEDNTLRLPGLWRRPADERHHLYSKNAGVAIRFIERFIYPHINVEAGIPFFQEEFLGDFDLCSATDIPSFIQIYWQTQALLQHYGYPTTYLDVTYDAATALFFACYNSSTGEVDHSGYGYIYRWFRNDLGSNFGSNILITRMDAISKFITETQIAVASRPQAQSAGSIRIGLGLESEEKIHDRVRKIDDLAVRFVVDRRRVPKDLFKCEVYFPDDTVKIAIETSADIWRKEIKTAIEMGDIEPEYADFFYTAMRLE